MKIQRIDLFCSPSNQQYGVQRAFSEGLQKSLLRLGIASSLLDESKILEELVKNKPDCTAGFSVTVGKHSSAEPLGIPHLSMILDSATYFPELLQNPNAIVSFVDEDSVGFFKMLGVKYVFNFGHAIDKDLLDENTLNEKRDLDVVMMGSYIDADAILAIWKDLLSTDAQNELLNIAERVLASPTLSHLQAFVELIEKKGDFEKELLAKSIQFFDMLNSLDQYIRAIDRRSIVEALDRPVHIFGAKQYIELWQKSVKDPKKLIFHPEVAFKELPALLKRSRIVINSFPMFKRGLHERLLMALSCGASVLCNDNVLVQKTFGKSSAILKYLFPDYAKANQLIEACLQDEQARLKAVFDTHPTIREKHTWDVRAHALLTILPSFLEDIRKNNSEGIKHLFANND